VVITVQAKVSVPDTPSYGRAIGVDVGLNDFLATSDGLRLKRPKFFVDLQSQLKSLQRRAAKKQKRSKNWEKAQIKVARLHHKINNTRKDFHLKTAHQLCDQADSIFVEDIDYRVMAKGFLGKHSLDAGFGEFRERLKWVCWKRGKFFAQVNHKGTSKQCPNCGTEWDNNLSIRWHKCEECGSENHRDVAAAEVICNRGIENYPRTVGNGNRLTSRSAGEEILGKWRGSGSLNCEVEKPAP
jgi:putative transposase